MQIVIGGDLVPTQSNIPDFKTGDISGLIGAECRALLEKSDVNIFNLECPLCSSSQPIEKCGPNLMAPVETIKGIAELPVSIAGLANNHILDQGWQGLKETMDLLKANHIAFVGAGHNLEEAHKTLFIEKEGAKIGLYACAEHEFSIASVTSGGANPFDALNISDEITHLKDQCDYLLVLYHGGKEYYRYPSPELQKRCRKMIEKGADVVVCQHSHCIGCREDYHGGTIIYGQGNFIFDNWPMSNPYTYSSLLLKLDIGESLKVTEIPIIRSGHGIRLAEGKTRDGILDEYHRRSESIKDSSFVLDEYKKFADAKMNEYLSSFLGRSILLRGLNKLIGHQLVSKLLSRQSYIIIQNFLECEAHYELFLGGVKNKLGKFKE